MHTARKSSLRSQQLEKAHAQQLRPSAAKNTGFFFLKERKKENIYLFKYKI